jgi:putative endonuclease
MSTSRRFFAYILTNNARTLYVGMTNDLARRVAEHASHEVPGFTQKYHIDQLVYFEEYDQAIVAIAREKEIKGWRREKRSRSLNPRTHIGTISLERCSGDRLDSSSLRSSE